jgi:hypothetical protein
MFSPSLLMASRSFLLLTLSMEVSEAEKKADNPSKIKIEIIPHKM